MNRPRQRPRCRGLFISIRRTRSGLPRLTSASGHREAVRQTEPYPGPFNIFLHRDRSWRLAESRRKRLAAARRCEPSQKRGFTLPLLDDRVDIAFLHTPMAIMTKYSKQLIILSLVAASLVAGCGGGGGGSSAGGNSGTPPPVVPPPAPPPAPAPAPAPAPPPVPPPPPPGSGLAPASLWTSAKLGGGGYVTGLIFHPTSENVLYARTDIGGAYRWNQATMSWVPITDGLGFGAAESRYHGVESIAVDPNNDQLVYMAAGMYTSEGNGRLYISSDRGDHWTYVGLPFPLGGNNPGRAIGERLMVDPNKPSTLFYGSRTAGLWKSVDSGLTWAQVTSLSITKLDPGSGQCLGHRQRDGRRSRRLRHRHQGQRLGHADDLRGHRPGLRHHGGPGLEPVQVHRRRRFVDRRCRPRSPAITSRTWCAPQTACSMSRSPMNPGPGAAGPARLYKFDGNNWTLLKDPNSGGTGTGLGLGGLSVSGTGASTRIALGVTNSWGNYSGQLVIQLSDDGGHDLARDRGHHAAHASRRRLLGLARRRRDRSVQPRPRAARPWRRGLGNPQRFLVHAELDRGWSTASRRLPSWAWPRRRPAQRTP